MRKQHTRFDVHVSLYSSRGWDQECCYTRTGELILRNKNRGTIIRMSADRQPFPYLRQEYWPKVLCTILAKNWKGYLKTRPSDDCSNYREPSKHGTWLNVFWLSLSFYDNCVLVYFKRFYGANFSMSQKEQRENNHNFNFDKWSMIQHIAYSCF